VIHTRPGLSFKNRMGMVIVLARQGKDTRTQLVIVKIISFYYRRGEVCSHVVAVLFKVETACRLGYNNPTCTSMPCKWNQSFATTVSCH